MLPWPRPPCVLRGLGCRGCLAACVGWCGCVAACGMVWLRRGVWAGVAALRRVGSYGWLYGGVQLLYFAATRSVSPFCFHCSRCHTLLLTHWSRAGLPFLVFSATLWRLSLAFRVGSRAHAPSFAVGGAWLHSRRSRWRSLRTIRPITRATRLIGTASSGRHGTTIRPARGYVLRSLFGTALVCGSQANCLRS